MKLPTEQAWIEAIVRADKAGPGAPKLYDQSVLDRTRPSRGDLTSLIGSAKDDRDLIRILLRDASHDQVNDLIHSWTDLRSLNLRDGEEELRVILERMDCENPLTEFSRLAMHLRYRGPKFRADLREQLRSGRIWQSGTTDGD